MTYLFCTNLELRIIIWEMCLCKDQCFKYSIYYNKYIIWTFWWSLLFIFLYCKSFCHSYVRLNVTIAITSYHDIWNWILSPAVGCANLRPPQHGWIRREDNEAIVGCDETKQTWHLKCEGNQWAGVIGKCQNGWWYHVSFFDWVIVTLLLYPCIKILYIS